MQKRGVNSGQRSASRVKIRHNQPVAPELRRISNNRHLIAGFMHHLESALQESPAIKFQEGFVRAHAGTFPSGKDETRARKLCLWVHAIDSASAFRPTLPK